MLPSAFLDRMERLLGQEFPAFLASYDAPRSHGIRVNTLKLSPEALPERLATLLEPVPWSPLGYYVPESLRPGVLPHHAAGLYYLQEPSAMAAAELLAPQPGERVLDLCAAPGGKSTHLASLMKDQGLLVANEYHPQRAQVLAENLERFGLTAAVVLNEDPDRLAPRFPAFFDRILVDAPCSGEGMFRKAPEAVAEWTPESPTLCARRQAKIVDAAVAMLRPGGFLLYSTCTFAPEENEQTLLQLLRRHPEMRVEPIAIPGGDAGRPDWAGDPTPAEAEAIARAVRLWPHRVRGEGHFLALLRREGEAAPMPAVATPPKKHPGRGKQAKGDPQAEAMALFQAFCQKALAVPIAGPLHLSGDVLYRTPVGLPDLAGLRVVRPAFPLGVVLKGRFEPSHNLALALPAEAFKQRCDLPAESPEALAYLRGEALPTDLPDGWTAVTIAGHPLGWAKVSCGLLKNHYPKGLRWTLSRDRNGSLRTKPA